MPYESFKCSHHVSIRGLVQDRTTGSWRYLIQVRRVLQDDSMLAATTSSSFVDAAAKAALWQRRRSSSSFAYTSPSSSLNLGSGHVYRIRRSFAEFKLLHAAMKPLMRDLSASQSNSSSPSASKKNIKDVLPSLPVDSIFAFFLGETQTMLQKKRLALENILIAIENHSAASDSSEYLEFLAKTDTYEQVLHAPLSPPPRSLASTASTASSGGDDDDESEITSSRSAGFPRASRRRVSRPELLKRESTDDQGVPRRSQPFDDGSISETEESAPVARENRVDFQRYSLV